MSDEREATDSTAGKVAPPRLTNSDECMQNAARVLRFAEGETNQQLFEQYVTLSERWMELGLNMAGGSD